MLWVILAILAQTSLVSLLFVRGVNIVVFELLLIIVIVAVFIGFGLGNLGHTILLFQTLGKSGGLRYCSNCLEALSSLRLVFLLREKLPAALV